MVRRIEATLTLAQSIAVDENLLADRHNRTETTKKTKNGGAIEYDLRNVEASSSSLKLICRLVEWRSPIQQGTIVVLLSTHDRPTLRMVLVALVRSGIKKITVITDKDHNSTWAQWPKDAIASMLEIDYRELAG